MGLGSTDAASNALAASNTQVMQVTARILTKEDAGGFPTVRVQLPVSLLRAETFLLGVDAGPIGAAALVMDRLFRPFGWLSPSCWPHLRRRAMLPGWKALHKVVPGWTTTTSSAG